MMNLPHPTTSCLFFTLLVLVLQHSTTHAYDNPWLYHPRHLTSDNHNHDIHTRKIIDGQEATPGRYPYQVVLKTATGWPGCGGTLIAADWVMSAAHCGGVFTQVEIGRHNLSDANEDYESIDIAFEVMHPDYEIVQFDGNDVGVWNDILLLKLKTPSSYETVKLVDESVDLTAGTNVTTLGWGRSVNFTDPTRSDVLKESTAQYINNTQCKTLFNETEDLLDNEIEDLLDLSIADNVMCTMDPAEITTSCLGDSGGPVIIKGEDASLDIQVGITSWSAECDPSYPQVKARVSVAIDFIKSTQACNMPNDTTFDRCLQASCVDSVFVCDDFVSFLQRWILGLRNILLMLFKRVGVLFEWMGF